MVVSWLAEAACAGMAPYFDEDYIRLKHVETCQRCPVIVECLMEGMKLDKFSDFGIFGGTDVGQRMLIRRGQLTANDVWQANLAALCET